MSQSTQEIAPRPARPGTAGTSRRRTSLDTSGETISVFNAMMMGAASGASAAPVHTPMPAGGASGAPQNMSWLAAGASTGASTGSRPNSAGANTSGGDRAASSSSSSSSSSNRVINTSIIKADSLLRIMGESSAERNNEVIVLAETGALRAITSLVDRGFDWDSCRGLRNFTPLHYACRAGHPAVVSELLRACPQLMHVGNDSGEQPLHMAIYGGHLLLAEQLLDRGAEVDATTNDGETALMYAARRNMPAAVRLLLQRDANPMHKDSYVYIYICIHMCMCVCVCFYLYVCISHSH